MREGWLPGKLRTASTRYRELGGGPGRFLECAPVHLDLRSGELSLQARFYAGEFGDEWTTECGRHARLLSAGIWNRESGPDFRDAVVLFDGVERCVGDIEIDIHASGWETHGHAQNPEFENVVLHCFFQESGKRAFARTRSNRAVAQVHLGEKTGSAAPPWAGNAEPVETPKAAAALVELAAQHRLTLKAKAANRLICLHGIRDAIFQMMARALGYRTNTLAMLALAQRCGWKAAASQEGEALLFGLAGFLEEPLPEFVSGEQTPYLLELWKTWWRVREREQRLILPKECWKLRGARPANHPHRRVAALHKIARHLPELCTAVETGDQTAWENILSKLGHTFWNYHWNLRAGKVAAESCLSLLGENRIVDILVNVYVPVRTALGFDAFDCWRKLVPGQVPGIVKEYANWLHPGISRDQLRTALMQQGLLQLGADFFGLESPRSLEQKYLAF